MPVVMALFHLRVHCRVGSLEIAHLSAFSLLFVHCRVGSLEI